MIQIHKDIVSIFASGHSVLNLSEADLAAIHDKSFTIFINYALCKFKQKHIDCLFWNDRKVSNWMYSDMKADTNKKCLWLAREEAFTRKEPINIYNKVDFLWERKKENLKGNYSIVWILQLIKKYYPNKKILIFGLDGVQVQKDNAKWYDKITKFDLQKRGHSHDPNKKIKESYKQIETHINNNNIYNCNLESKFKYFELKNWKDIK